MSSLGPPRAPRKTPRNEFILDNCASLSAEETREQVYRRFGEYMTPNAVYIVIQRAKNAGDPRTKSRRRSRRSPWFGRSSSSRKPQVVTEALPLPPDVPVEDLPATALPIMSAFAKQCRFPLRGSGLSLIVCGADVGPRPPYCPSCWDRAIERPGRPSVAAPDVQRLTRPEPEIMIAGDVPAAPRAEDPVPAPLAQVENETTTVLAPAVSSLILPPDHFFSGLKRNGYPVIYMDPPWKRAHWSSAGDGRSPSRHYGTRTIEEMCADPVADLAAKDCHLFMWLTDDGLLNGWHLPLFEAWGFKPSSLAFVWLKTNDADTIAKAERWEEVFFCGMGKTTRKNAEYIVLGRRGSPPRVDKGVRQIIVTRRQEHSRKPVEARRRIERYAGAKGVEIYSRESGDGWDCWGNEVGKFDEVA